MSQAPVPILYTIPNFITAGSGQAMLNVVERLDRKRFAPSVCVLRRGGRLEARLAEIGVPLLELPFSIAARPLASLPFRLWKAAQHFRPYGFQVWHSFHYADDYTEPLIAYLSGARHWVYTKKNMNWGGRAWQIRTRLASRIAIQNQTMLERFFVTPRAKRKVRWIPCGVDTQKFQPREPKAPARLNLRETRQISKDTTLVGSVANILPIKGQRFLIEAIAKVPNTALLIAGAAMDTAYFEALQGRCNELGITERVHFLGAVQDIPAFDTEIDIFVLASIGKGEGSPVALLEALSCGAACIATNVPGSKDLLVNEQSGLLVEAENAEHLANALQTLVASPALRQKLGDGARQQILENFAIEREIERYEALYAELLRV